MAYPPLSSCAALNPHVPPNTSNWSSGRLRLWARRHAHPGAYLRSYLLPDEIRKTEWTPADHRVFISALQLVRSVPAHSRFEALSLLLPGRTATDVKRYFNRVGRAGLIHSNGKVKKRIFPRAKEGKTVGRPVFLKRSLWKFVKTPLLLLDDTPLHLPKLPPCPKVNFSIDDLTHVPAPQSHQEGEEGVSGERRKANKVGTHKKANGIEERKKKKSLLESSQFAHEEAKGNMDGRRATKHAARTIKQQVKVRSKKGLNPQTVGDVISGNSCEFPDKTKADKASMEQSRVAKHVKTPGNSDVPRKIEKNEKNADTSSIFEMKSVKLKLTIRNVVTNLNVKQSNTGIEGTSACENSLPRVPRCNPGNLQNRGFTVKEAECIINNPNSTTRESVGEVKVSEVSRVEKRVRFAEVGQPQDTTKRAKCSQNSVVHRNLSQSSAAGNFSLGTGTAQDSEHLDRKSIFPNEEAVSIVKRMSTSRRLQCSPKPSRTLYTTESAVSCSTTGKAGTVNATKSTETFTEEHAVMTTGTDENMSYDSDDLSAGSYPDTIPSQVSSATGLSPDQPAGYIPSSAAGVRNKNRVSIGDLLCNDEDDVFLKPLPRVPQNADQSDVNPCCERCSSTVVGGTDTGIYQIVAVEDGIQASHTWYLPKTGVAWTKAWAAHHFSARLSGNVLASIEKKLKCMDEEARELMAVLNIFGRMIESEGEQLGHVQERYRLVQAFEPYYREITEFEPVAIKDASVEGFVNLRKPNFPLEVDSAEHKYALDFLNENLDMQYDDIVGALVGRWKNLKANFLARLEDMESRQSREVEGYKAIRSVMQV